MSGDIYFGAVNNLLHCEGTNGSTTITDSANSPKTISVFGNAQLSNLQSKWGTTSLKFDGDGDYITTPMALNILHDKFTFEAWSYLTSVTDAVFFANQGLFYVCILGGTLYVGGSGAGNIITTASHGIVANQWQYIAFKATGSGYEWYVDSATAVATTSSMLANTDLTELYIGGRPSQSLYSTGYICDVRITLGEARTIGVPTAAFPDFADPMYAQTTNKVFSPICQNSICAMHNYHIAYNS